MPWLTPRDLPNPKIEPTFLMPPALGGGLFTASATWEALPQIQLPSNSGRPGSAHCPLPTPNSYSLRKDLAPAPRLVPVSAQGCLTCGGSMLVSLWPAPRIRMGQGSGKTHDPRPSPSSTQPSLGTLVTQFSPTLFTMVQTQRTSKETLGSPIMCGNLKACVHPGQIPGHL